MCPRADPLSIQLEDFDEMRSILPPRESVCVCKRGERESSLRPLHALCTVQHTFAAAVMREGERVLCNTNAANYKKPQMLHTHEAVAIV